MNIYRITFTSRHRATPTSEITEITLSFDIVGETREAARKAAMIRVSSMIGPDTLAHFTTEPARWSLVCTLQHRIPDHYGPIPLDGHKHDGLRLHYHDTRPDHGGVGLESQEEGS